MSLRFGDIVPMISFTYWTPHMQAGFKAPKGECAVFVLLGSVDKKNIDSFDPAVALRSLGLIDGPTFHDKHILEYDGDVFVVFDPTDDGSSILGACRTLEEAKLMLNCAGL